MRKTRFTTEQIITILQEHAAGAQAAELTRRHGISRATLYDFGEDQNHGAGDPHAHDWDWTKTPPRQPGRPLGPDE
jgi:hypothetical protein